MTFLSSIQIPEEKYLELKAILENEHGKDFDMEDVIEIADDLVELYLLLYFSQKRAVEEKD
ncbi:MAG: hypothetical protein AAB649_04310 [Patescibacteria group bacterium]